MRIFKLNFKSVIQDLNVVSISEIVEPAVGSSATSPIIKFRPRAFKRKCWTYHDPVLVRFKSLMYVCHNFMCISSGIISRDDKTHSLRFHHWNKIKDNFYIKRNDPAVSMFISLLWCLIIIHKLLDQFASNFDWEIWNNHGHVLKI